MSAFLTKAMFRREGEQVTYHPRSGDARVIRAVVRRNALSPLAEASVLSQDLHIGFLNRSMSAADDPDGFGGVSTAELDTGGDMVEIADRVGAPTRRFPLKGPIEQDAVAWMGVLR
jgi:hypothetical protein